MPVRVPASLVQVETTGPKVVTVHTCELEPQTLRAIHALMDAAFAGTLDDADHEHCLGGVHALLRQDGELVGHGSVVQRRILHAGEALRTGYVEGVAIRPDRQRRGYGGLLMAQLERVVRGGYRLGALSASDAGAALYERRGWRRWTGPTSVLAPSGPQRTAGDEGSVYVLPVDVALDLAGSLACDWRDGDVW